MQNGLSSAQEESPFCFTLRGTNEKTQYAAMQSSASETTTDTRVQPCILPVIIIAKASNSVKCILLNLAGLFSGGQYPPVCLYTFTIVILSVIAEQMPDAPQDSAEEAGFL